MKQLHCLLIIALTMATSGCATMCDEDCCECGAMAGCIRNKCRAYGAWCHWKPVYCGLDCQSDFGSGFRAGYVAMAQNGNATVPALPPESYWSPWYQNQSGHEQMQAWFDGYSHGALAAERDGVNQWSRIRTSLPPVNRGPAANNIVVQPPVPSAPPAETGPQIDDQPEADTTDLPPPATTE